MCTGLAASASALTRCLSRSTIASVCDFDGARAEPELTRFLQSLSAWDAGN